MFTYIYVFFFEAEQGSEEGRHSKQRDEGRSRRIYVEQVEGCTPITTYASNIPEELPWDSGDQQLTLESCRSHYNKLQHDIYSLDLLQRANKLWRLFFNHCKIH